MMRRSPSVPFLTLLLVLLTLAAVAMPLAAQFCMACAWEDSCLPVASGFGHADCKVTEICYPEATAGGGVIIVCVTLCRATGDCDFEY